MPKTDNYKAAFNAHVFTSQANQLPFSTRPYRWAVSIHEGTVPTGVISTTLFTDPTKYKSIRYTSAWSAIGGDLANGVQNTNNIEFDYVPTGQTWTITYYVIWAVSSVGGVDQVTPLHTITLSTPRVLPQSHYLVAYAGNLTIREL